MTPTDAAALTPAEVAALAEGAQVIVTWDGGNGPHHYVVRRHWGLPCAHLACDHPMCVGLLRSADRVIRATSEAHIDGNEELKRRFAAELRCKP